MAKQILNFVEQKKMARVCMSFEMIERESRKEEKFVFAILIIIAK